MIGPSTTIRGSISGDEALTVDGRVEGAIRLSNDLTISKGAAIVATVDAQNVVVNGSVTGDVNAAVAITVESGAMVVGDVTSPRIHIADGARFKGRIDMDFEIPPA